ncbi:hypothetical protein [uncultured Methanolobus sp.]|uniref:hypothetical protein n=1 Tax=uncultured Methanolobus sp. TaxID=218300 RepID=UPI002AABDB72|nr:hypothetical protein [uncultured Methanolobus sp.]
MKENSMFSDVVESFDGWVLKYTLSHQKPFYWKVDGEHNIFIRRKFKHWKPEKVSADVLYRLNDYMANGSWKYLANNVQKLGNGTEIEGLGSFLYRINPDTSFAQLSSHLGAIFTNADVWECNKSERKMKFRLSDNKWEDKINQYYSIGSCHLLC